MSRQEKAERPDLSVSRHKLIKKKKKEEKSSCYRFDIRTLPRVNHLKADVRTVLDGAAAASENQLTVT